MPDPVVATVAAALVAAALFLIGTWRPRAPHLMRSALVGVLAVAAGFAVGCWWLGVEVHWPPVEDQHRLLLIVLPAVVTIESLAIVLRHLWHIFWLLRAVVALGAGPTLLYQTVYLTEASGPGTREWTSEQAGLILGSASVALIACWFGMVTLNRRLSATAAKEGRRSYSVPLAVGGTCLGAGALVMLSGYASGGQIGLPLGAAMIAVTLVSWFLPQTTDWTGPLGLVLVGTFAVLFTGRFFGTLSTPLALTVLAAPLCGWLMEMPRLRGANSSVRGVVRVGFSALVVAGALGFAYRQFQHDSVKGRPSGGDEPTLEDYMSFGK